MQSIVERLIFLYLNCLLLTSCEANYTKYKIPDTTPQLSSSEIVLFIENEIKENPDNANLYFRKSREEQNMGELEKSLASIINALEINPDGESFQLQEMSVLIELGLYKKAQVLGENLMLNKVNDLARLNEYLGESYFGLKQYESAQKHFKLAINMNPYEPNFYYRRALICISQFDTAKAEYNFKRVLKLNPDHRPSIAQLSDIYNNSGREQDGARLLDLFDYSNIENSQFALTRVRIAKKMKDYDLADSLLYMLLSQNNDDIKVINELADLKLIKRNYDTASVFIKMALSLESQNSFSRLNQARFLASTDQLYSARNVYEKIVKSDSSNQIAIEELNKLNGKIAYLRRIDVARKERATLPTLELRKIE